MQPSGFVVICRLRAESFLVAPLPVELQLAGKWTRSKGFAMSHTATCRLAEAVDSRGKCFCLAAEQQQKVPSCNDTILDLPSSRSHKLQSNTAAGVTEEKKSPNSNDPE